MDGLRVVLRCEAGIDVRSTKNEVCVFINNYEPIKIKYYQSSSIFFPALCRNTQHTFSMKCYIEIHNLLNIKYVFIFSTNFPWNLKVTQKIRRDLIINVFGSSYKATEILVIQ